MKVSLISGLLVEKDAISASTRMKADALMQIAEASCLPLDLRVYVLTSDYDIGVHVKMVQSVNDIVFDPHFLSSDLIIYDFGIYNELFNSIHLAPENALKLVHFHNITPPDLVPEYEQENMVRSREQMINLFEADLVLAGGRFNIDTLIEYGIEEHRIKQLEYVTEIKPPDENASGGLESRSDFVDALFVGRFVPSKGLLDLLRALQRAREKGAGNIRLTLIGNLELSSKEYINEVRAFIDEQGLDDQIDFVGKVSDEELHAHYERAQLFLISSYHEGFCVPVIEALSHGCYVISYDAGNLRYAVSGFGNVIPTGDIEAMAEKIVLYALEKSAGRPAGDTILRTDGGDMNEADFIDKALEYTRGFSFDNFRSSLHDILRDASMLP